MRLFGGNSAFKIPQSVDEPMAPLNLLYWAVYACLKSHVKDIDPAAEFECGMFVGDNVLEIYVPKRLGDAAIKAAMECYILKHLDWKYSVRIDDRRYLELRAKTESST